MGWVLKIDDSKIDDALKFWDETEAIVKQAENINQEMIVPAVSELRYGGRKFVDYIRSVRVADESSIQSNLDDFLQCCIRARHDAIDALVSYIELYCRNLEAAVGTDAIISGYPKYGELRSDIAECSKLIVKSRENRENRNIIYGDINRSYSDKLFRGFWALDSSRSSIFGSAQAADKKHAMIVWMLRVSAGLFLSAFALFLSAWLVVK